MWSGCDDVAMPLIFGALRKCAADGSAGSRCGATMLSMYSLDAAKMGVIAHEPTLWNVSCDRMMFGWRTDSIWMHSIRGPRLKFGTRIADGKIERQTKLRPIRIINQD